MNPINPDDYFKCEFDPILFHITENFGIRYYGVAYLLGFVVGVWLLKRYHDKGISPYNPDQQTNLFIAHSGATRTTPRSAARFQKVQRFKQTG